MSQKNIIDVLKESSFNRLSEYYISQNYEKQLFDATVLDFYKKYHEVILYHDFSYNHPNFEELKKWFQSLLLEDRVAISRKNGAFCSFLNNTEIWKIYDESTGSWFLFEYSFFLEKNRKVFHSSEQIEIFKKLLSHASVVQSFKFIQSLSTRDFDLLISKELFDKFCFELGFLKEPYGNVIDFMKFYIKHFDVDIFEVLKRSTNWITLGSILDEISASDVREKKDFINKYRVEFDELRSKCDEIIVKNSELRTIPIPELSNEEMEKYTINKIFSHFLPYKPDSFLDSINTIDTSLNFKLEIPYLYMEYFSVQFKFMWNIFLFMKKEKSVKWIKTNIDWFDNIFTFAVSSHVEGFYMPSLEMLCTVINFISRDLEIEQYTRTGVKIGELDNIIRILEKIETKKEYKWFFEMILENHPRTYNSRNKVAHLTNDTIIPSFLLIWAAYQLMIIWNSSKKQTKAE